MYHPHLKAHYRFESTQANLGIDASGNGNHGTVYGATQGIGQFGGGADFDGVNDYIDLEASDDLRPANITVSFYANPTVFGIGSAISLGGDSTGRGVILFSATGGNVRFIMQIDGILRIINIPKTSIPLNAYNHYVATYNGIDFVVYFKGFEYDRINAIGSITYKENNNVIGKLGDTSLFFNGSLDEVKIFNKACDLIDVNRLRIGQNPR